MIRMCVYIIHISTYHGILTTMPYRKEKEDTEAQLKAAILVQKVWRSRGVWSQVLQYKRRACTGTAALSWLMSSPEVDVWLLKVHSS